MKESGLGGAKPARVEALVGSPAGQRVGALVGHEKSRCAIAAEQRFWWLDVGAALAVGKDKENRRPGQKFSEWVQEMFPGLGQQDASDAIWLHQESMSLMEIPAGMSHPSWIRRWHNEAQLAQANTDPVLAHAEPPVVTPKPVLSEVPSRRVLKLHQRVQAGDEGSPIADRALKAYAKQHGVTVGALVEAAELGGYLAPRRDDWSAVEGRLPATLTRAFQWAIPDRSEARRSLALMSSTRSPALFV